MSLCWGKKGEGNENEEYEDDYNRDEIEENEDYLEPSKIYFDDIGNILYDNYRVPKMIFDRNLELVSILRLNPGDDKIPGQTWYLMDSPWIEAWLFAVRKELKAPRPGPCKNNRLITWKHDEDNPSQSKWVCQKNLAMANSIRAGDYRRVTKETWDEFKKFYPESGPAITIIYTFDVKYQDSGYYPTDEFIILDPPPNPDAVDQKKSSWWWSSSGPPADETKGVSMNNLELNNPDSEILRSFESQRSQDSHTAPLLEK